MKVIIRTCEQVDRREIDIRFSPRVRRPARTVARRVQTLSDTTGGGASLYDWDKDGQYEVLIVGESLITRADLQLLRFNRTSRRLETLFRGESLDVSEQSGYLVSTVNLSYRGDTQAAYKVLQPHVRIAEQASFSIFTDPRGRITCLFAPPSGHPAVVEHGLPRRARNAVTACESIGRRKNLLNPSHQGDSHGQEQPR